MQKEKLTKEDCIKLLQIKYAELKASGEDRYPKRNDFSDEEVAMIKAFLGPFPRALEAAKIKPLRDDDFYEKKLEKRIRSKRRKREFKTGKNDSDIT